MTNCACHDHLRLTILYVLVMTTCACHDRHSLSRPPVLVMATCSSHGRLFLSWPTTLDNTLCVCHDHLFLSWLSALVMLTCSCQDRLRLSIQSVLVMTTCAWHDRHQLYDRLCLSWLAFCLLGSSKLAMTACACHYHPSLSWSTVYSVSVREVRKKVVSWICWLISKSQRCIYFLVS